MKAGTEKIGFHVTLASSLPAALATSDITLNAGDQNAESVLCVKLHLAKSETFEEIAETVNNLGTTWKAAVPEKFASLEDVKPSIVGIGTGAPLQI